MRLQPAYRRFEQPLCAALLDRPQGRRKSLVRIYVVSMTGVRQLPRDEASRKTRPLKILSQAPQAGHHAVALMSRRNVMQRHAQPLAESAIGQSRASLRSAGDACPRFAAGRAASRISRPQ